jgi:hypothetical protein
MNLKKLFYIYFTMLLLTNKAFSELVFKMAAEENKNKNTINDAFLLGCMDWACYKIKEFQISPNNFLNCYKRNVTITFSINFQNGSRSNSFGFLSTLHGNQIMKDKNPLSDECQVVKR